MDLPAASSAPSLLDRVIAHVEIYMQAYDASHDFTHIQRVARLALHLASTSPTPVDTNTVLLAAYLHDVGDAKYLRAGEDGKTMIATLLLSFGAPAEQAARIQTICSAVSYSSEIKDPQKVLGLVAEYPELACVQDADRLDAIGAVGIGRCFTFGGAKGLRGMGEAVGHFEEKLVRLEGMMKTEEGKRLARVRTERLQEFMGWWRDETKEGSAQCAT